MTKRGLQFMRTFTATPDYNTATIGWTLSAWTFTDPKLVENYINVPGRPDGPLDASTALTDGDPRYGRRELVATLEYSEGTRAEREDLIIRMKRVLDGWEHLIRLPDFDNYRVRGRVQVERLYNDNAHASVRITAVCEPWLYPVEEKTISIDLNDSAQEYPFSNTGRKLVAPTVVVTGADVTVYGWQVNNPPFDSSKSSMSRRTVSAGTYQWPEFYIFPSQSYKMVFSSEGVSNVKITYREAVL